MSTVPNGYMKYKAIVKLYEALKPGSKEDRVDALWANILPIYFPLMQDFVTETQPRPKNSVDVKEDVRVRYVEHTSDKLKPLFVIENKKTEHEGQGAVWAAARTQLIDYLNIERATAKRAGLGDITLYGAVTVGHYSKFYVYLPGASDLQNFYMNDTEHLEFRRDEARIVDILGKIHEAASRPSSRDSKNGGTAARPGSSGSSRPSSSGKR